MGSVIGDFFKELVFRNRERDAIPVLDGPMRPNSRLDECRVLTADLPQPDDVVTGTDGAVYVSSDNAVHRFAADRFGKSTKVAEFAGPVTAMAAHPWGGIVVATSGNDIAFVGGPIAERRLAISGISTIKCPTAITVGPQGELYLCDGSEQNTPDRWVYDLMQKGTSGRVLRIDAATGSATVLADQLHYPSGLCIGRDGQSLIVSEAWSHSLLRLPFSGPGGRRPEIAARNLPGYPGRIIATDSGYYLALFALRTQLVDFVLTEDSYRTKMVARIDPQHWIAPALCSEGHYLEPVQGGGLRKHGSVKAWAPPRSYGLVMFLDDEFEPEASLHSRVGGNCHGITGVAEAPDGIYVCSKGSGKIVLAVREAWQ